MKIKRKSLKWLLIIGILIVLFVFGSMFYLFLGAEFLTGYGSSFRCPNNLMETRLKINESVNYCEISALYKDYTKLFCVAVIYPNNNKEILQKDIEGGTSSLSFKIPSNATFYVYYNDCETRVPGGDVDFVVKYYFESINSTLTTTSTTIPITTTTIYYPSTIITNNESYESVSIFDKPIIETIFVTLNKIIQIIKEFFENIMKNIFRI